MAILGVSWRDDVRSAIAAGFETMDSHHELEDNLKMLAEMERVGGQVAKRFRIYQKAP